MSRAEWDGWLHFMTRHLTTLYGLVVEDPPKKKARHPTEGVEDPLRDPNAPADPNASPQSDIERMAQAAQRRRAPTP